MGVWPESVNVLVSKLFYQCMPLANVHVVPVLADLNRNPVQWNL